MKKYKLNDLEDMNEPISERVVAQVLAAMFKATIRHDFRSGRGQPRYLPPRTEVRREVLPRGTRDLLRFIDGLLEDDDVML